MKRRSSTSSGANRLLKLLLIALAASALCAGAARAEDDRRADKLFETAKSSYDLERWEDAGKKFYDFMAAAPYDPRNDQAQYCVGRCMMHRSYLNKAIEEFTFLVEDFPESKWAMLGYHERAQCHLRTRKLEKAIEDMEEVTKRVPRIYHGTEDAMLRTLYEYHRADVFWLAKHYLENKQHDNAIAVYQRLPHPIEAFRHVVDVYYGLKRFDKIRELIDTLSGENRHQGFKFLIEFYGKSKAFNQLKDIFSKLLQEKEADNHTDDLVWTTATSFNNFGREHWEWALGQISNHYPRMARRADFELAVHKWRDVNYQDQLELFVIKYRTGHDTNSVLRWKGYVQETQGKPDEARETYRRMDDPGVAHWYAAQTYDGPQARTKDLDGAIEEYVKLRTAYYSAEWSAFAQWRVAELYRQQKRVDEAVEAYRHIAKRFPSVSYKDKHFGWHYYAINAGTREFGPDAQLAIGDTLREAARYDDAIMEYRILISKYAKSEQASQGAYRTGLCYEGNDDVDTAIAVFKSVLRRYPKTKAASEAHTHLETQYDIADVEVSDAVDIFEDVDAGGKTFLEDPGKMFDKK